MEVAMEHNRLPLCALLSLCLLLSACGSGRREAPPAPPPPPERTDVQLPPAEPPITVPSPPPAEPPQILPPPTPEPEALPDPGSTDVLEIGEKLFVTQINDIYFHFDDYRDKTIIVEGMYGALFSPDGDDRLPAVYRRSPGCCGNDGWAGFLLQYDGEYPAENEWIRVTGTPELKTDTLFMNLYLNVSSIEVREERGLEFVIR